MNRFKWLAVIVGTFCALGVSAASAFALPDISALSESEYPIHMNGELKAVKTSLGTSSGVTLEGEGVTLLLLVTKLSALGTYLSVFTKVHNPKNGVLCNNKGAAKETGTVEVAGNEFHLVLGPGGSKLLIFVLFLVAEFEIECGALKVKVKGNALGDVKLPSEVETDDYTSVEGVLEGEKGKPKFTEYFNDAGETVKASLLSNSGAGFVASDEDVLGTIKLVTLESKMFLVTGR